MKITDEMVFTAQRAYRGAFQSPSATEEMRATYDFALRAALEAIAPMLAAQGEVSDYEIRKGKDGAWCIYHRSYNVRVATFNVCSKATIDEVAALLAAQPVAQTR